MAKGKAREEQGTTLPWNTLSSLRSGGKPIPTLQPCGRAKMRGQVSHVLVEQPVQ